MKMPRVPLHGAFSWQAYNDETATYADTSFTTAGLLEQINTTRDSSDYLWYLTEWVTYTRSVFFHEHFVWSKIPVTYLYEIPILFSSLSSVKIDPNEEFLRSGKYPVLTILSAGHALRVFINGQLAGMQLIAGLKCFWSRNLNKVVKFYHTKQ